MDTVANYVHAHPYKTIFSAVSIGLTPVLGAGWVLAVPLKLAGFGAVGVGAGTPAAMVQAAVYGGAVPARGWFATLQALGATVGI